MPNDLERWKSKQIAAAIDRGVNPLDATRAMNEFLASLPPGADPTTYIRPAESLNQDLTKFADDANETWFSDNAPTFKRLLSAGEEPQQ